MWSVDEIILRLLQRRKKRVVEGPSTQTLLCASLHRVTHGIHACKLSELVLKHCMWKMFFMSRTKHTVCSPSSQASCWDSVVGQNPTLRIRCPLTHYPATDRCRQKTHKAKTWLRAAPGNCHKRLSSCSWCGSAGSWRASCWQGWCQLPAWRHHPYPATLSEMLSCKHSTVDQKTTFVLQKWAQYDKSHFQEKHHFFIYIIQQYIKGFLIFPKNYPWHQNLWGHYTVLVQFIILYCAHMRAVPTQLYGTAHVCKLKEASAEMLGWG